MKKVLPLNDMEMLKIYDRVKVEISVEEDADIENLYFDTVKLVNVLNASISIRLK